MKALRLENGLRVITQRRRTKSVAVEVMVKTGSNNETKRTGGLSHVLEHMLFEGTKNRSARTIANEIEKKGGEFNAYTSNERTAFYISILKKHFDMALEVLADIIKNPLFDEKALKKEKRVILDEIKLVNDQPRFYQWVFFSRTLFRKHQAKNPIYGTKESVRGVKKRDLVDYYNKYYVPNNMVVSVVGDIKNVMPKIKDAFIDLRTSPLPNGKEKKEPKNQYNRRMIRKKTMQSYLVLGYKTPKRSNKESYVLDVIRSVLGRGQSGTLFEEIRQKRGLAYEVGVNHEANARYGFFAVYLSTHKKNIDNCIDLIIREFNKLQEIGNRELKEAKDFLEGEYHLKNEDNTRMADQLAFFELAGDSKMAANYVKSIKRITKNDVKRVAKKYLNKNYTLAIIEQG